MLFPSPYGVIFILTCISISHHTPFYISFRLLTELYSFLLTFNLTLSIKYSSLVSVSLRSYIHSYGISQTIYESTVQTFKFPSPYGVIFILTNLTKLYYNRSIKCWFPSPYGVIFILTCLKVLYSPLVSFPSPYGVIFILT